MQVFTGLLRLDSKGVSTKEEVTRLLINELARVFYDRCLPEDRDKSLQIISEGLRIALKVRRKSSYSETSRIRKQPEQNQPLSMRGK